jgi:signal transduction histidine kinase
MKARLAWLIYGTGAALAAAALTWVSATLLDLETAHDEANARALTEETVRAAMWQFESELSPLVADQASRPYFHYASFYPAEGAYGEMFRAVSPQTPMYPSPLIRLEPGFVQLHFQYGPDGALTSPQAPRGRLRRLAQDRYVTDENVTRAEDWLKRLAKSVSVEELRARLPTRTRSPTDTVTPELVYADERWEPRIAAQQGEFEQRAQATKRAAIQSQAGWTSNAALQYEPSGVREGPTTALWEGETLLLARRISINDAEYVQGCVLDWPAIRASLQHLASVLLPGAEFRPVDELASAIEPDNAYRLASLPIAVVPGDVPLPAIEGISPIRGVLIAAWASMALAALSLAFVLGRTLSLSARREEFVSAVSHELRTPLTTFRMYAEMLHTGRVSEDARGEYLATLHHEAVRLSHLVENVLAYAGLEHGGGSVEELPLPALLERSRERLLERAQAAGMELELAPCAETPVRADPDVVERILFNLVDNACKYGASPIRIECRGTAIVVSDHGPGVSAREAANLFKPFRKSALQAANSAPGVGLGLALSRRLARAMGGDLELESRAGQGCRFVLTLRG